MDSERDAEGDGADGARGDSDGADIVVVVVTVPSEDIGELLAGTLIVDRLAACVKSMGPVRSTYCWEGSVERSEEWRLEVVTVAGRLQALSARVRELHPYDVPEIIALAVLDGDPAYLAWVRSETADCA